MFEDFISLIFPENCLSCNRSLYKKEDNICIHCLYHLPKTFYHLELENELERRFWGRVNIYRAGAFLHFTKGSSVQRIIFKIKYHGKKEGAGFLGRQYGESLQRSGWDSFIDIVIPVPMHQSKLKKRGYNPSAIFSEGLSDSLKREMKQDVLIRTEKAVSQTGKSRFDRWENVKKIYNLTEYGKNIIEGKNILLTDDVITTGATVEACASRLLENGAKSVSVAAIAVAGKI
jgi:ComF family protein